MSRKTIRKFIRPPRSGGTAGASAGGRYGRVIQVRLGHRWQVYHQWGAKPNPSGLVCAFLVYLKLDGEGGKEGLLRK
jgi:hypothetical protein